MYKMKGGLIRRRNYRTNRDASQYYLDIYFLYNICSKIKCWY